MSEKKEVFMDINVFTVIVEEIRGAAYECVFSDYSLKQAGYLDTFNAGKKMHEILAELHKTDEMYRQESYESLPTAFLKMRDSMIAIDKACAESLTVEKVNIGDLKR